MKPYTPGPWAIVHPENIVGNRPSAFWQPWAVQNAKMTTEAQNDGYVSALCPGPDSEANARLIAAAPDLLAALKQWDEFARQNYTDEDCSFWAQTRAAIAKATGGTNV